MEMVEQSVEKIRIYFFAWIWKKKNIFIYSRIADFKPIGIFAHSFP